MNIIWVFNTFLMVEVDGNLFTVWHSNLVPTYISLTDRVNPLTEIDFYTTSKYHWFTK
jgi:hypothetical protein